MENKTNYFYCNCQHGEQSFNGQIINHHLNEWMKFNLTGTMIERKAKFLNLPVLPSIILEKIWDDNYA